MLYTDSLPPVPQPLMLLVHIGIPLLQGILLLPVYRYFAQKRRKSHVRVPGRYTGLFIRLFSAVFFVVAMACSFIWDISSWLVGATVVALVIAEPVLLALAIGQIRLRQAYCPPE